MTTNRICKMCGQPFVLGRWDDPARHICMTCVDAQYLAQRNVLDAFKEYREAADGLDAYKVGDAYGEASGLDPTGRPSAPGAGGLSQAAAE